MFLIFCFRQQMFDDFFEVFEACYNIKLHVFQELPSLDNSSSLLVLELLLVSLLRLCSSIVQGMEE